MTLRDWDSFLEVYGIPSVFLVGPPNTPEAKEDEYQRIAEQLIADGRGYLPYGSDIKYVNGAGMRRRSRIGSSIWIGRSRWWRLVGY